MKKSYGLSFYCADLGLWACYSTAGLGPGLHSGQIPHWWPEALGCSQAPLQKCENSGRTNLASQKKAQLMDVPQKWRTTEKEAQILKIQISRGCLTSQVNFSLDGMKTMLIWSSKQVLKLDEILVFVISYQLLCL